MRFLPAALAFLLPAAALAQGTLLPPCTKEGNCGVSDLLILLINVSEIFLGISGAVALGIFVWAGFRYVFSRGNPDEVKKANAMMVGAVIGIAIILFGGVIVRFATDALTGGTSAFPMVGAPCETTGGKKGVYVSVPTGFSDPSNPGSSVVPEGLVCIPTGGGDGSPDGCDALNRILAQRSRPERYACRATGSPEAEGCLRGLCSNSPADFGCCRNR